jgi:hypothetical protein
MTFYPEDNHNPCGGRRKARAHNLAVAMLATCATKPANRPWITTRDTLRNIILRALCIKLQPIHGSMEEAINGDKKATGDACKVLGLTEPRRRVTIGPENEAKCRRYLETEVTQQQLITFLGAAEQSFIVRTTITNNTQVHVRFRFQDVAAAYGDPIMLGYVTMRLFGTERTVGFVHGLRTICLHPPTTMRMAAETRELHESIQRQVVVAAIAHHQRTYPHSKPSTKPLTRENAAHVSQLLISPFVRRPTIKRMRETTYVQRACVVNLPIISTEAERAQAFRVRDEYNRWLNEFVRDHGLNTILFREMVRTRFGVPDLRST